MGRPLRRHEPGQYYLITTRCHQARFLLRPDSEINDAVLEWLARTQQRYPGVRIFSVCAMSNHLHLVVRDERGELADWTRHFLGHFASAVNRIRDRRGVVFERRHSAEPILDHEALIDRLVYTVTNPVAAGLCKRADHWPGVVLYATGKPNVIPVTWVDRDRRRLANERARRGAGAGGGAAPRVDPCLEYGRLVIDPLPTGDGEEEGDFVEAAIEAREQRLAGERRRVGRKTLTRRQVLAQQWRSAPSQPSRSPRPACHASDPGLRAQFIEGFSFFVGLFRQASERLRDGDTNVSFPLWCYPPGLPLVRPATNHAPGAG